MPPKRRSGVKAAGVVGGGGSEWCEMGVCSIRMVGVYRGLMTLRPWVHRPTLPCIGHADGRFSKTEPRKSWAARY